MFGFTYKGKHSYNDFGIILGKFNIPVVGDIQEYRQSVPGIQGTVALQASDLQDRIIELTECYLVNNPNSASGLNPFGSLQQQARAVAAWLNPRNTADYFIFDNDEGVSYLGVVQDKVDTTIVGGVARQFTIKLRCDPFVYSSVSASAYNNARFDTGLPYDSGAEYGQPSTVVTANGSANFNLWNGGTASAYPVLTVTPVTSGQSFSNLTLTNNTTGESFNWSGSCSTSLVADSKNMVIFTTSGTSQVNQFGSFSGEFVSLGPNELNSLTVTVTGNIQLSFDYRFPFY